MFQKELLTVDYQTVNLTITGIVVEAPGSAVEGLVVVADVSLTNSRFSGFNDNV